jgi:hypothetical protein
MGPVRLLLLSFSIKSVIPVFQKKYEVHIFLDELYLWHMHIMVSEQLEISQNTRNNRN